MDNLRLYVRGGSGGMGLSRLGGQGGKGGDVWVVAANNLTLKRIKDKYPQKRFLGGAGANSRFVSLNPTWTFLSEMLSVVQQMLRSVSQSCFVYLL